MWGPRQDVGNVLESRTGERLRLERLLEFDQRDGCRGGHEEVPDIRKSMCRCKDATVG